MHLYIWIEYYICSYTCNIVCSYMFRSHLSSSSGKARMIILLWDTYCTIHDSFIWLYCSNCAAYSDKSRCCCKAKFWSWIQLKFVCMLHAFVFLFSASLLPIIWTEHKDLEKAQWYILKLELHFVTRNIAQPVLFQQKISGTEIFPKWFSANSC